MKYTNLKRNHHLPDFGGDTRDQRSYTHWSYLWMGEARRVTKPGGVLVVSTDWRQLPVVSDAVQIAGWVWRGVLVWAKPDARPQPGRPRQACEFFVWASNGPFVPYDSTPLDGFWVEAAPRQRHHQTQKPLTIYRTLTRLAPPGGVVLDPFMGSGTTGVAARAEGRRFVGVEMSDHYLEVAEARIAGVTTGGGLFEQQTLGGDGE